MVHSVRNLCLCHQSTLLPVTAAAGGSAQHTLHTGRAFLQNVRKTRGSRNVNRRNGSWSSRQSISRHGQNTAVINSLSLPGGTLKRPGRYPLRRCTRITTLVTAATDLAGVGDRWTTLVGGSLWLDWYASSLWLGKAERQDIAKWLITTLPLQRHSQRPEHIRAFQAITFVSKRGRWHSKLRIYYGSSRQRT